MTESAGSSQVRFRIVRLLLFGAFLAVFVAGSAMGAASDEPDLVLFWMEGCPHCEAEREFLDDLRQHYPEIVIAEYEVRSDQANRELFIAEMKARGLEATSVPTTFIGDRVWIGFDDRRGEEMRAAIADRFGAPQEVEAETPASTETAPTQLVDVPVFGAVDVGSQSLVVATLVIGFVDGFNPCSLWVLSILLALVLHTGSRRRVLAVGGVFLAVTTLLYGVYIAGLYSVLSYIGYLDWIRIGIALIALGFGIINVKEYFAFRRGPSLTISEARKPKLYRQMRELASPERPLPAVLAGTGAMAVGVSLIETPCTAGFPVLWADLLSAQGVGVAAAAALFALYMAVFLLDELAVFGVAVVSMRAAKLQERHGRLLKLIGGMVMIVLAGVLVFAPELMESVVGALAVFALAAIGTVIAIVIDHIAHPSGHRTKILGPPPA